MTHPWAPTYAQRIQAKRDAGWHPFWVGYPGDARKVDPLPAGACPERILHDGDPSTPCVLLAGHGGDHEDPEGYTETNWG